MWSNWKHLIPHTRAQFSGLLLLFIVLLVQAALVALQPWPTKIIIDSVLGSEPLPAVVANVLPLTPGNTDKVTLLITFSTMILTIFLIQRIVLLAQSWLKITVGNRLVYSVGGELFDHLQNQSLSLHARSKSGDLIRRITEDSVYARQLILDVLMPAFTAVATLGFMLVLMLSMHWSLTLIALLAALPMPLIIKWLSEKLTFETYQYQISEAQLMAHTEQSYSNLSVIQAYTRERDTFARFKNLADNALIRYMKSILVQLKFGIGIDATTGIGTALMLVVGGFAVLDGELSIGELVVFITYLSSLYGPMQSLAYMASGIADARGRAKRVRELLDQDERVFEHPNAQPLSLENRDETIPLVEFDNLSFHYDSDTLALDNINLQINHGETVALVGPSGSGKSTLASLLLRFYDPQSGSIRVAGHDIRELSLSSLRKSVAVVLQEPFLFPMSVAENIAYGRPEASRKEIENAARIANANYFIEQLPQGYDTVLVERGNNLSGGQRQRLSIARALLKDAPILILDEPTAALDTTTEQSMLSALDKLRAGRTTLVIAHRLSTIKDADRIAVIENGRLAEIGKHDELLKINGAYATLYREATK